MFSGLYSLGPSEDNASASVVDDRAPSISVSAPTSPDFEDAATVPIACWSHGCNKMSVKETVATHDTDKMIVKEKVPTHATYKMSVQESVEASDRSCRDRRVAAAANAAGFYKGSSPPAVSSRCQCDDDPNAQWICPACIAAAALQQAAVRSDIDGSCLDVATLKPLQSADLWNYPVHESEASKAEWRRQLCGRSFALREPIG